MKLDFAAPVVLIWIGTAQATCTSDLSIDNYDNSTQTDPASQSYTYDDGTTADFRIVSAENKVTFKPIDINSYVFTHFPCVQALSNGYNALNLSLKAPVAGASITFELQTSESCSTSKYTSYFINVTELTGNVQRITVPLSDFEGANLDAIQSIVYQDFTPGEWELYESLLSCQSTELSNDKTDLSTEKQEQSILASGDAGTAYPVPETIQPTEPS